MPSRRRFLAALSATGTAAIAGCSSTRSRDDPPAESETTDWPTSRHDAVNSGYAADTAGIRTPAEAWRAEIGMASAPPVATEESVFVPAGDHLLVLDAETGDESWRVEYEGKGATVWAPPTVSDGVAYLGDGRQQVRAFDAETGERRWRFETDGSVYAAPTLAQGRLFFGTSDERVYALDPETGEKRWHRNVFGSVTSSVAVRPPGVYVTTEAGEVYALSLHGEGAWRRRLPDRIQAPPTVVGGTVFVACNDGRVHALRANRAGRTEWRTDVGGFPEGVSVAHGRVYVVGMRFHALGAEDGGKRWSVFSADSPAGLPAVAGDTVYVGTEAGRLHAYRPGGGVGAFGVRFGPERWTRKLGQSVERGLAVADGRVYAPVRVSDEKSALVALEST
ncbi:PQQ-binding-like beta-propeller repeat protein [Halorussus lipolyticus]|uniref:outer membrane protein assembly factor BamB family protein n=1 Tax=Halorussus lipolyticus TaxID=3034024 RepID=UPI0023E8E7F2|nr:PQQ-binding-like beta-propeller repeat protein [Halorussus sp. DT80]